MMELYKKPNRYYVAPKCPCGKSNRDGKFVPFVEGKRVFTSAGYCHSCGKTFYPDEKYEFDVTKYKKVEIKSISFDIVSQTLCNYQSNNFAIWLQSLRIDISKVLKSYPVGTDINGSTIFWYIDFYGMVRTAKVISYNPDGHRSKKITPYFKYSRSNGYENCIFGENLLKHTDPNRVVVLVESEKTAIVGSQNFPDFCWIATGGSNGLNKQKSKVLANRKVIVVPDCDDAGRNSAERTKSILLDVKASVTICDIDINLNNGEDIADLIQ